MNPAALSALLDSLPKPEKGQAEEMHGIRFDMPINSLDHKVSEMLLWERHQVIELLQYFAARCQIAESLRVPEGLRESIKAAVLEAMRSAEAHENFMCMADEDEAYSGDYEAWCDACVPDSPPSEANREEVKG